MIIIFHTNIHQQFLFEDVLDHLPSLRFGLVKLTPKHGTPCVSASSLPGHREGEGCGGRAQQQNAGKNTTGGRNPGGSRAGRIRRRVGSFTGRARKKPWKHKTVGLYTRRDIAPGMNTQWNSGHLSNRS